MSSKKIIVNPEYLKVKKQKTGGASNSKTLKRREKQRSNKEKVKMHSLKPKTLKRNLLHKIKQYQKKRETSEKELSKKDELPEDTRDSFEDALKTLQDIINKNKREKQRTRKQQQHQQYSQKTTTNPMNMSNSTTTQNLIPNLVTHEVSDFICKQPGVPKTLIKPDPPYGCLKNGRKQTFRQYHKSMKQPKFTETQKPLKIGSVQQPQSNPQSSSVSSNPIIKPYVFNSEQMRDSISLRKEKLQMAKNKLNVESNKPAKRERIKRIIKKTRRKYNLGKKDGKVHVLIKNGDTRKKLKQEIKALENTSLRDLKQNLKKKNLIQTGSSAPEYILRDIYKNSILSGEVQNTNSSVVLKNYLSELTS